MSPPTPPLLSCNHLPTNQLTHGTCAEVVVAFAGACVHQATQSKDGNQTPSLTSSKVTSQQLKALISMPWAGSAASAGPSQLFASSQRPGSSQNQTSATTQAQVSALLILAAAPVLGFPGLASTDFSSKAMPHGMVHKALQRPQASVQAAATILLPVIIANTAEAAQSSARGQATVGIRLLQKGLDCLAGLASAEGQSKEAGAKIRAGVGFALEGFVSMQHVMEHRLPALCQAVKGLLYSCRGRRQQLPPGSAGENSADGGCEHASLLCWPPVVFEKLSQLPVKGRGGAAVPDKALQALTTALTANNAPALQQVCMTPTDSRTHCTHAWPSANLMSIERCI